MVVPFHRLIVSSYVLTAGRFAQIVERFALIDARSGKMVVNSDPIFVSLDRIAGREHRNRNFAPTESRSGVIDARFAATIVSCVEIVATCDMTCVIFDVIGGTLAEDDRIYCSDAHDRVNELNSVHPLFLE